MCVITAHIYTVKSRNRRIQRHYWEIICTSFVYDSSMGLCVDLHQMCVFHVDV